MISSNEAKYLIRYSVKSLGEIGYQLGFNDPLLLASILRNQVAIFLHSIESSFFNIMRQPGN
ncbi:hypothetical protein PBAL39_12895 [Pedobacter sp. BAL39]|nr:hypothetical protein PBAL39_12895 [Pedobacter sp. BAL39]